MTVDIGGGAELRLIARADARALFEAVERNRTRLREWLPWLDGSRTLQDSANFASDREREHASQSALTCGIWAGGALAGTIGLHRINRAHRATSIGYWVEEAHSGQGLITRACRAVVTAGFREYGLHRIEIRCATGNYRSCAVPRRLGFVEEGILREAEWLYDHWVDLRVFSMLEEDWRADA